ncbi:MAG: GTP-binding protein, partial [Hyphomicrobiales bacterium]
AITRSDLLIINKTELAPHVGVDLQQMETDAHRSRNGRPTAMTDLRSGKGLEAVVDFLQESGGL